MMSMDSCHLLLVLQTSVKYRKRDNMSVLEINLSNENLHQPVMAWLIASASKYHINLDFNIDNYAHSQKRN